MKVMFKCKCPTCGVEISQQVEVETIHPTRPHVLLCEPEYGGCDNYFAVITSLEPHVEILGIVRQQKLPEGS